MKVIEIFTRNNIIGDTAKSIEVKNTIKKRNKS